MLNDAKKKLNAINGLLHICSSCRKINDGNDNWTQIETYIKTHVEPKFTHGMCPECAEIMYPEVDFTELNTEKHQTQ